MDQAQELNEPTAEQESADFLAGFNAVRPDDDNPLPERHAAEPDSVVEKPELVAEEAKVEAAEEADEPTYFGMSESQIKSLLERSARVDEIENQLRRAHGKIGELNANFQSMNARPTPSAPAEQSKEADEWLETYPEFAAIAEAKARKIAGELIQEQMAYQQAGNPAPVDSTEMEKAINIAVMDATQEGWRETISSQDFTLWIATQPADVQETFNTTISAKELGKVIKGFDSWKTNTQDRSNKSKQRLEQALIPSSNAAKVTHAPSATDEFEAGFNRIRNQRN